MGVKCLIFLIVIMVLVSACYIKEKTKPVVTDIVGDVVKEVQKEEPKVGEKVAEKNETIPEEVEEEIKINETIEEIEINESEKIEVNKSEEEQKEGLPPETRIIIIKDLKLEPQELTIKKGDTVVWKHEDKWEQEGETRHYLAEHSNEFRSPILYYGKTFEHTFNKTGIFTYIDVLYKDRDYMRGKIVVE